MHALFYIVCMVYILCMVYIRCMLYIVLCMVYKVSTSLSVNSGHKDPASPARSAGGACAFGASEDAEDYGDLVDLAWDDVERAYDVDHASDVEHAYDVEHA